MDPRIATTSSIRPASPAAAWRLEIQYIPSYPLMTATDAFRLLRASLKRWEDSGKEGAPRPPNKFMLYRTHVQSLRSPTRGKPERQTDASREISDIWRQVSSGEREYYGKLATWLKLQHERLVPNYKYDPKRKRRQRLLTTEIERSRLGTANHQGVDSPAIGASNSRSRRGRSLGARAPYPHVQHCEGVSAFSLGPQDRRPASGSGSFLQQSTYVEQPRTWDAANVPFVSEHGPTYGERLAFASPFSNSGDAVHINPFFGGAPPANPVHGHHDHHAVGQPHEPAFFLNPRATYAPPASYSPDSSTPTSLNSFNSLPTPPLVVASGPGPAIFECPANVYPAPHRPMQAYISPPQGPASTSFGSYGSAPPVFPSGECAASSAISYPVNSFLGLTGIPDDWLTTFFSMAT